MGKLISKQGRDLNLEQVKLGMAWHYKKYKKEQSPDDRSLYAAAEEVAKGKRVGLWSDPNPVPPGSIGKRNGMGASEGHPTQSFFLLVDVQPCVLKFYFKSGGFNNLARNSHFCPFR